MSRSYAAVIIYSIVYTCPTVDNNMTAIAFKSASSISMLKLIGAFLISETNLLTSLYASKSIAAKMRQVDPRGDRMLLEIAEQTISFLAFAVVYYLILVFYRLNI